ncbi:MAG TPA: DpnI domain-containing protein [Candidatus Nanoarchaeia archaeon]|nr:DpnI domain-containing protein [Candidatus Nanoarchaeia archaeon]
MELSIYQEEVFDRYKSNSQRIRVLTENWMGNNMFCPACSHLEINKFPNNQPVADFFCPQCNQQFQLKSQKSKFGKRILDGAYTLMIDSIKHDIRPNFFLLKYNTDYYIENLFLLPYFFFTETIIEKRKPLSQRARRAGWIGCNVLLNKIPPEGIIKIIHEKEIYDKTTVHNQWKKVSFIKDTTLPERGWTLDVLRVIHALEKKEFSLKEVYEYEEELAKDHPENQHVKAKIRQQLQFLRDKGIVSFRERGKYIALR